MSAPEQWSMAFARQADADFKTWQQLQNEAQIPKCHKLHFLQMACEKLCKAHLLETGSELANLQTSHGYIAKPLPTILLPAIGRVRDGGRGQATLQKDVRHLSNEIEVLSPAIVRGGQRPDNCEYPWGTAAKVISPLDWSFPTSQLLLAPSGRTFVKLLRVAIDRSLK